MRTPWVRWEAGGGGGGGGVVMGECECKSGVEMSHVLQAWYIAKRIFSCNCNSLPRSDPAFAEVTCRACRVFFMNGTCRSMHAQSNKSSRLTVCTLKCMQALRSFRFFQKKKPVIRVTLLCYQDTSSCTATSAHHHITPHSEASLPGPRSIGGPGLNTRARFGVPYPPTSSQRVLNFDDGQAVSRVRRRRVATMLQRDPP